MLDFFLNAFSKNINIWHALFILASMGKRTDMDICLYNSCWSPTKRIRLMIIYVIILRSMPYTEMTSRDTCISKYTTKARHMRHPFSVVLPWSHSIKLQSVSVMVLSELRKRKWYLLIDNYRNYGFDCFYLGTLYHIRK